MGVFCEPMRVGGAGGGRWEGVGVGVSGHACATLETL